MRANIHTANGSAVGIVATTSVNANMKLKYVDCKNTGTLSSSSPNQELVLYTLGQRYTASIHTYIPNIDFGGLTNGNY